MPWTLDNAEAIAAEAPRSFFIPPAEVRRGLVPGDVVKLIFRLEREDGELAVERMWVEVDGTAPYSGRLVNEPHLSGVVAYGDRVEFGPEHVCAYAYPELGYDVDQACYIGRRVAAEDVTPAWLYFDETGDWQAHAGDATEEELSDPSQVLRWTVGYLADKFPAVEGPLREGAPRDTWWRFDGERYVRDTGDGEGEGEG